MAYTINISAADPREFILGTEFFGEEFSSKEELKNIFKKYIPKNNIVVKLTFSSAETTSKIKSFGNKLAAEGKNIPIFALAAIAKKDKFNGITIYYVPCGWIDDKGTFKFILEKNGKTTPQYDKKLSAILADIGIEL